MIPTGLRRRTFAELRQHGSRVRHGSVRMTYLATPSIKDATWEGPRLAYAFSRRFGNAVERNRGRRRLRDAFDQAWQRQAEAPAGAQPEGAFLLAANRTILSAPFQTIVADVEHCLIQLSGADAHKHGVPSPC